ncbi:endonuclease domain-containing protein [Microbacterium sp. P5_E9]
MIAGRTAIDDPIVNVLFHVARCLPQLDALAVWESAIRKGKADPAVLAQVDWGSSRARELAAVASLLSDSGLETVFIARLRGLPLQIRQQVRIDGHPVDALIGERLIVQLDGFEHHRAKDRRRDLQADARLALRGYTVLRFDYQQVLFDWPFVEGAVLTAVAQGLHRARR